MNRQKIIAANWKMNLGVAETEQYLKEFIALSLPFSEKVEVVIAPPMTSLSIASSCLKNSKIILAAQNVASFDEGAYTGEVSAKMLMELGVNYVIVGHSERRTLFGETYIQINQKLKQVDAQGLTPIFCIGETLEEREKRQLEEVLTKQIKDSLVDLSDKCWESIVFAYEPVWAIGTGKTATSQQAQEAHALIRGLLAKWKGDSLAQKVRIQYGGSMKASNARELLEQVDIDGGLIGSASLRVGSFLDLLKVSI